MAIKLIKACKELNVGMSTAMNFFAKQGKEINPDPNTRIDDELYLMLAKEFNRDMALKLEAERQAAERQSREMQTVSIEQPAPSHIETEIPKPKVVGQIELDEAKKAREEAERQAAEAARIAAEAEAAAKAAAEAAAKAAAERIAREEAARKAKEEAAKTAKMKEAAPAKAATQKPAAKNEKKSVAPAPKPAEKVHTPAVETAAPKADKPEIFTLGKPVLKDGPKVVGSIDLSAINQATRPAKKSKEEKKKEREERQQQQQQATEKRKRERIKNNKVDINDVRNQKTKPSKKKSVKVEVDDEEVQRQIKDTLTRLQGQKGKSNTSKYKRERREQEREKMASERAAEQAQSKVLKLTEFVTANDLAVMMNLPVNKIIATCMSLGLFVSINQRLDAETINIVAEEFGFTTEYVSAHVVDEINADEQINEEDIEPRCPIVTVMGHVDHGKTSLLDHIRNTNVIAGEAGGITQHIGAYNVTLDNGRHITFLDTPGHEAFTAMRARGAQVTDIAIIIIAADDDIMPQTKEAISHAVAANVPIVFAINKVDNPHANPDKIKEGLAAMNFLVEEWGGKYQSQDISAKKGTGVNELLEKVLLEADMLELKANPNRKATGTIIESSLDKGRGYVATLLVSNGTLHQGDVVLAGTNYGRIKALFNERGQRIQEVGPSMAATLLGFNGAPQAGDQFHVMDTEQEAREIANKREQLQREQDLRTREVLTLEKIGKRLKMGSYHELNLIVKADVDGSVEALADSFIKLSTENIVIKVIYKGVGQISENDVTLAAASEAIIVGFQVRPSQQARKLAERDGVEIRQYSVIYDAIEDVKEAMEGMLEPVIKEEVTANIEVRQVYHISKVGYVAGAYVIDGKVKRTDKARLIRDGIVIFTGEINALKRFKDDVKEVTTNFECGISLTNCNDIKEGDLIETFQEVEVKQKL